MYKSHSLQKTISIVLSLTIALSFSGCLNSLGSITAGDLDTFINQSIEAIDEARLANAETLANETFTVAEEKLEKAKNAVNSKEGLKAIELTFEAKAQAKVAETEAIHESQTSGLNTIIQNLEEENFQLSDRMKQINSELRTNRSILEQLNSENEQLKTELDSQSDIIGNAEEHKKRSETNLERIRRDFDRLRNNFKNERENHNRAKEKIKRIESEISQAKATARASEAKAQNYEKQIAQLHRKLAGADQARKKAIEKAKLAQAQALSQGQNYSQKIDHLKQQNLAATHEKELKQKEKEAREYVKHRRAWEREIGSESSLNSEQIADAKAVVADWSDSWNDRNIDGHLGYYAEKVTADRIEIETSGGEKRKYLNRSQLLDELEKMATQKWHTVKSTFDSPGNSLRGTFTFKKAATENPIDEEKLYDIWRREVWVHEENNQWKIYGEVWRIYRKVPHYSSFLN